MKLENGKLRQEEKELGGEHQIYVAVAVPGLEEPDLKLLSFASRWERDEFVEAEKRDARGNITFGMMDIQVAMAKPRSNPMKVAHIIKGVKMETGNMIAFAVMLIGYFWVINLVLKALFN